MIRSLVLLTLCCSMTDAATAPTPQPHPVNKRFGVNLERLTSWSRSRVYIDATRTAYGFDTIEHPRDAKAPLGANGLPTGDFGMLVIEGAAPSMAGTYHLILPGSAATIVPSHGSNIANLNYDAAANVTRADVNYNAAASPVLMLQFKGVKLAGRPRLLRPGYTDEDDTKKIFTDEFIGMVKTISPSVIRSMDFVFTNNNLVEHWSQRSTRQTPIYTESAGHGGPVEDMIEICNRTGADLWLNVPIAADEEYRAKLADLVAKTLRPDLHVYLEYGNENWNRSFSQHAANLKFADADRSRGMKMDASPEIAGWQRTAQEIARVGQTFKAVIRPDRVRPILAGQGVNQTTIAKGLEYIAKNGGRPSELLWGIAIAPYAAITPELPAGDWRILLLKTPPLQQFYQLARQWRLASCCYECGPDLAGSKIDPAEQKDPRMENLLLTYYRTWQGDGPMLQFNICDFNKPGKIYGLTDDVADLTQPKFKAAVTYSHEK